MKFTYLSAFNNPAEIAALAIEAEKQGFDAVSFGEHLVNFEALTDSYTWSEKGDPPWDVQAQWADVFSLMSFIGAKTSHIEFMTSAVVLPRHNPFEIAQQICTVSQLTKRRIWLGVGVGWCESEFKLVGQDFKNRGKRTDEMIEVMRKLWQGKMVEHHGKYYDFERLAMLPTPTNDVNIIFGGASNPGLDRTVRLCDGWVSPTWTVDQSLETVARLRQMLKEAGREKDPFEIILLATDCADADSIKRAKDAGIDNIICSSMLLEQAYAPDDSYPSLQVKIDSLKSFADTYIR